MSLSVSGHDDEASALDAIARGLAINLADVLDPGHRSFDELIDLVESFDQDAPGQAVQRAVLDGETIPGDVAFALVVIWLRQWDAGGRTSFQNLVDAPRIAGEAAAQRRLDLVCECAGSLSDPVRAGTRDVWSDGLLPLLDELAGDLLEEGRPEAGVPLLIGAAQLSQDPHDALRHAEEAAVIASQHGDARTLAMAACLRATFALGALREGSVDELEVFDAMDAALQHIASAGRPDGELLRFLVAAAAGSPTLERLVALAGAVLAEVRRGSEPSATPADGHDDVEVPFELARRSWGLSLEELVPILRDCAHPAYLLELARSLLEPQKPSRYAHARWTSWTFEHPGYRRAVPHSRSIEKELDADDIKLVLQHETTHVLSMVGGIGTAVMALRAAAIELELDLWALAGGGDPAGLLAAGTAELGEPTPLSVELARIQIGLLAKMHVLQDVWNPWFEGLAVFSELCDDPTADDVSTVVADVLTQLVDVADMDAGQREDRFAAERTAFERAVAQAQRTIGPTRLQFYSESMSSKYLAGLLAVRGVVARWRKARPELTGHAAIRLLLHATRFGTYEGAVPDLSLPEDEFAEAAQEAMVAWCWGLASLSKEDLSAATSTATGRWSQNRPVDSPESPAEMVGEATRVFAGLVHQALLPGEQLGRDPTQVLAEELLEDWSHLMSVLPLGRTSARFWVNRPTGHLVYVVRTMECRAETNRPGYDLGTAALTEDEMDALERQMADHPFDRLMIARFADLSAGLGEGRGYGRQVLAFRLGSWLHLQPRGWMFGATTVDKGFGYAVRLRLQPSATVEFESRFLDEQTGAARRTADWVRAWSQGDPANAAMAALGAAASAVVDHDGRALEQRVSVRLLTDLLGDATMAEDLARRGLSALAPYEPELREASYVALRASGASPAESTLDLPEGHPLRALLNPVDRGWDVVPARIPVPRRR